MFAIGVAAIGVGTGCGEPSEPERFGQVAAQIYDCDQDLTIKAMPVRDVQKVWPGARAVEGVICGKDVGDADTMIHIATYPSAEAATKIAANLDRRVPVCLHGHTLIGSYMYPANDYPDEDKAAKLAARWAHEFCKRIGGRAIRQRYGEFPYMPTTYPPAAWPMTT